VLEDALLNENGTTNDATFFENGGNFNMFNVAVANPQTLLVASTTSTGTNTQTGIGRILVVDISDPDNINSDPPNPSKIVGELQLPGTVHVHGLALDGNLAFAVASQGGWLDPFVDVLLREGGDQLYLLPDEPVTMVFIGGMAQFLMMPIIGIGTVYLRHRHLPASVAPSGTRTAFLWFSSAVLVGFVALYLGTLLRR
jgi:hypothetical protein